MVRVLAVVVAGLAMMGGLIAPAQATGDKTPPAPRASTALFAIDDAAHTLVRFDVSGDAAAPSEPTVVASHLGEVTDLEVDSRGTAYVAAGGKVIRVPLAGRPKKLGKGDAVETDAARNVYLGRGSKVVRISPAGKRRVFAVRNADNLSVAGDGTMTTGDGRTLTTYRHSKVLDRRTVNVVDAGAIIGDSRGTVYLHGSTGGGANYAFWARLAPRSSELGEVGTRYAEFGGTVAPDDTFVLAESASWCPALSEGSGSCTPDREVTTIARYAADGTLVGTVETGGFSTRRYDGVSIAADSSGAVYAADRKGAGELVRVPADGGPATHVADGQFGLLAVG